MQVEKTVGNGGFFCPVSLYRAGAMSFVISVLSSAKGAPGSAGTPVCMA